VLVPVVVSMVIAMAVGIARARPSVSLPLSVDDIDIVDGRACWKAVTTAGCNVHGCWDKGGGCNVHGCWNGSAGMCNVHGCSDVGTCNVHGCPRGHVKSRTVCVAEDDLASVLGYDPAGAGDCNVHGCWNAGGGCNVHGCWNHLGGCNVHGCWNSPFGACNVHGCSERGVCNVHGCP
jgi:hypothetical protein